MLEFKVNDLISLKLEDNKTNLYVNNELFRMCKFVLLTIPENQTSQFNGIKDIDEIIEKYNNLSEDEKVNYYSLELTPETVFWGHCSNIQAWVEHNYDTTILDNQLAFPLLKELASLGDTVAKEQFKSQIIKVLERGHVRSIFFFLLRNYLSLFTKEENPLLWDLIYKSLSSSLSDICQNDGIESRGITFATLELIIDSYKHIYTSNIVRNDFLKLRPILLPYRDKRAEVLLSNAVKTIFEKGHQNSLRWLIDGGHLRYLEHDELSSILLTSNSPLTTRILRIFKESPQYEILFNKILERFVYIDKKRRKITGVIGLKATSFVVDIISALISLDQSIKTEFEEIFSDIQENPLFPPL